MNNRAKEHPDALLAGYSVDGLPPAQRRLVANHLAGCEQCRARLRSLQTTAMLFRNLPPPELPRSFLLPPSTAPRPVGPRPLLPLSFLSAAAVLFLALGLSLVLSRSGATVTRSEVRLAQGATQITVSSSAHAFAAATTTAVPHAAAARAPAPRPPASANSGQEAATAASAAAPSLFAAPTHPTAGSAPSPTTAATVKPRAAPAVRPRPGIKAYQVLLGGGGVACLVVAVMAIVRNRRLAPS